MKRPVRIEGAVAFIPLTRGYEAVIDVADVPLIEGFSWYAMVDGSRVYAAAKIRTAGGKRQQVRLHQKLTGFERTDHRDGDGLNNKRSNLRAASPGQNARNCKRRADNKSGVKGVFQVRKSGRWMACIRVARVRKHLGVFGCRTAAQIAYAKASREMHGDFGRTA